MYDRYIVDGEIHPLSKDFAYILTYVEELKMDANDPTFSKLIEEYACKYAEYIYRNEKEKTIKMIRENILRNFMSFNTPEDYQLIYRSPQQIKELAIRGTLALKFKRAEKDNLDNESKN